MRPVLLTERVALLCGDSKDVDLGESCVDSIVCDPPAGISFMGREWDGDKGGRDQWVAWLAETLAPSFRALKPGGHALVWALPRTSHWTAMALELAGFEIRDRVSHFFGTGFPKSLTPASAPIPDGTGTALKPACEDWWLVRKPLSGTVGANVASFGTGVLQIGACRIGYGDAGPPPDRALGAPRRSDNPIYGVANPTINPQSEVGRWPAHVTLDEEAAAMLDEQSGSLNAPRSNGSKKARGEGSTDLSMGGHVAQKPGRADPGGASRFFYVAKAPRSEKDAGCEHLPPKSGGEATGREEDSAGLNSPRAGAGRKGGRRNVHPTVKPIELMRWLCRLITPPGGTVLDPFTGSGTTGIAAIREGLNFVGVEREPEYIEIAKARISKALEEK